MKYALPTSLISAILQLAFTSLRLLPYALIHTKLSPNSHGHCTRTLNLVSFTRATINTASVVSFTRPTIKTQAKTRNCHYVICNLISRSLKHCLVWIVELDAGQYFPMRGGVEKSVINLLKHMLCMYCAAT